MKPYNVPSKKYIVINNDYQFIILITENKSILLSMKLAQDMGNLVIQENGVREIFCSEFGQTYFLEVLSALYFWRFKNFENMKQITFFTIIISIFAIF